MIKFVYFDVGGTVEKDFSATNKWSELLNEFQFTEETWQKYYGKIDIGIISPDSPIPYKKLLAGFINRFEKNESIWPVITEAKKHFRIGLLTNMYPEMLTGIFEKGLMPPIDWEIVIDSTVEGCAKPGVEIYQLAQDRTGVKPNEILFVENSEKNLTAPRDLGWQTFYYDSHDYEKSSKDLLEYLKHAIKG